jgi:hypothetical protein
MANLNQLLQKYVNMDYDELLDLAKFSLSQFLDTVLEKTGADGASKICAVMTAACLGADGKLSALENKFFNDLLGVNDSYSDNLEFVRSLGTEEARELVDGLVDSMSADDKAAAISFCLCFLAVDETITRDEVAFIDRLLG